MVIQLSADKFVENSLNSFKYFNNSIFPHSFENEFMFGSHLNEWADTLQHNKFACIQAPRKHSKSTTIYSYLMWLVYKTRVKNLEIFYVSYKKDLAGYHINKMKNLLLINPAFADVKDLTPAETIAKYTWDNHHRIVIEPEGILSFKRGRHPDLVILDDVLADPTEMLNLSVIKKINRIFFEQIISIPKEGGEMKIIGTPQTPNDFLFQIKEKKEFKDGWGRFPAIVSEKQKKVLWPERFPFERLMELKDSLGEKAFNKEYMLSPVYSEESFFKKEELLEAVDVSLETNLNSLQTRNDVIAGWDIGKKTHPSHFTIFEIVDDIWVQRFEIFMDGWDYDKQLKYVEAQMERFQVDKCYFDNTRGEFEKAMETGEMDERFIPITFSLKSKYAMAVGFEKAVMTNKIKLLDKKRMIDQILCVTNDLQAIETPEGHGDSFWSIALIFNYEIKSRKSTFRSAGY